MLQTRDALKLFQRTLISPIAHAKGWNFTDKDGHIESQFKALVFGSAGLCGDQKVIEAAKSMFKDFASGNRKAIHPNIRGSVYSIVLRNGGEEDYNTILNEYRTASDADERNTALRSLGRVKDENLIQRTLSLPLSDEVKGQDVYLPIAGLRSDAFAIDALWKWMQANWEAIQKKAPPGLSMLSSIVQMCTSGFTTEKQLQEVRAFFNARSTKGFDRSVEQSCDAIQAKAGWLARDKEDVEKWLQENGFASKGKL